MPQDGIGKQLSEDLLRFAFKQLFEFLCACCGIWPTRGPPSSRF